MHLQFLSDIEVNSTKERDDPMGCEYPQARTHMLRGDSVNDV